MPAQTACAVRRGPASFNAIRKNDARKKFKKEQAVTPALLEVRSHFENAESFPLTILFAAFTHPGILNCLNLTLRDSNIAFLVTTEHTGGRDTNQKDPDSIACRRLILLF